MWRYNLEIVMQKSTDDFIMFDPPRGWLYGFPKAIPMIILGDDKALSNFLRESGYPEEDILFAIKHSRYWNVQ